MAVAPLTVAVVLSIAKVTLRGVPSPVGTEAVADCVALSQVTSAPICSNRKRIGTKVRSLSITGGWEKPRILSFRRT